MRRALIPGSAALVALVLAAAVIYGLTHQSGAGLGSGPGDASGGAPAPEFIGISDWENTPGNRPLTMRGLRGKVVLVDFWTYSCINCQRTFPYLRAWQQKYAAAGLVIVGVHSPEFAFEKSVPNIRAAIARYDVRWPVAVDPHMETWNVWNNQYWPAEYLVDRDGLVRHTHFGEGEYDQTEASIRALLGAQAKSATPAAGAIDPGITADSQGQTSELYANSERGMIANRLVPGASDYNDPTPSGPRRDNTIYFNGRWDIGREFALHPRDSAAGADYFAIDYTARRVFMVAANGAGSSGGARRAYISLDGADLRPSDAGSDVHFDGGGHSYVDVDHSDLFNIVARPDFGRHALRISPVSSGFELFTFTFGS